MKTGCGRKRRDGTHDSHMRKNYSTVLTFASGKSGVRLHCENLCHNSKFGKRLFIIVRDRISDSSFLLNYTKMVLRNDSTNKFRIFQGV